MQHQGALARRRRAFEWRATNSDQRPSPVESGQHLAELLGAGDGIEFVDLGQARRGVDVVVGAECHDQEIGFIGAAVGGDTAPDGIDRRDRLALQTHARLHEVAVRQPHRLERRAVKHHVELRVAEDERVALVDQGHLDAVGESFGQQGAELEAAKSRPEDNDARLAHFVPAPTIAFPSQPPTADAWRADFTSHPARQLRVASGSALNRDITGRAPTDAGRRKRVAGRIGSVTARTSYRKRAAMSASGLQVVAAHRRFRVKSHSDRPGVMA